MVQAQQETIRTPGPNVKFIAFAQINGSDYRVRVDNPDLTLEEVRRNHPELVEMMPMDTDCDTPTYKVLQKNSILSLSTTLGQIVQEEDHEANVVVLQVVKCELPVEIEVLIGHSLGRSRRIENGAKIQFGDMLFLVEYGSRFVKGRIEFIEVFRVLIKVSGLESRLIDLNPKLVVKVNVSPEKQNQLKQLLFREMNADNCDKDERPFIEYIKHHWSIRFDDEGVPRKTAFSRLEQVPKSHEVLCRTVDM
jgi:hypothetical protein